MAIKNPFVDAENYRAVVVSQQEKTIRKFYEDLLKDIQKQIKSLDAKSDETNRVYLNSLKNEINSKVRQINLQTGSIITNGVSSVTERVLQNNQVFLNNLGFAEYTYNPQLVVSMSDFVVSGKLYGNKWSLSSSIWGNNLRTQRDINQIVARGIVQNKSTYEIAKQLEKYVNPDVKLPVQSGVMGEVDYNAQRLARTMVQHAYQEAFVEATKDNPFVEAYQWITSGMSNVCALCIEREEADEYGLGPGIYPKDALPLDHPNGNCTFDIVTSWDEESAREAVFDWNFGELNDEELEEALDKFADTF